MESLWVSPSSVYFRFEARTGSYTRRAWSRGGVKARAERSGQWKKWPPAAVKLRPWETSAHERREAVRARRCAPARFLRARATHRLARRRMRKYQNKQTKQNKKPSCSRAVLIATRLEPAIWLMSWRVWSVWSRTLTHVWKAQIFTIGDVMDCAEWTTLCPFTPDCSGVSKQYPSDLVTRLHINLSSRNRLRKRSNSWQDVQIKRTRDLPMGNPTVFQVSVIDSHTWLS